MVTFTVVKSSDSTKLTSTRRDCAKRAARAFYNDCLEMGALKFAYEITVRKELPKGFGIIRNKKKFKEFRRVLEKYSRPGLVNIRRVMEERYPDAKEIILSKTQVDEMNGIIARAFNVAFAPHYQEFIDTFCHMAK